MAGHQLRHHLQLLLLLLLQGDQLLQVGQPYSRHQHRHRPHPSADLLPAFHLEALRLHLPEAHRYLLDELLRQFAAAHPGKPRPFLLAADRPSLALHRQHLHVLLLKYQDPHVRRLPLPIARCPPLLQPQEEPLRLRPLVHHH